MFSAHGSFKIARHNKVLVVSCAGAWNLETVQEYVKMATALANPLLDKPFCQITLLSDWELATPDVEPLIAKLVATANARGLCREAVVNDSGQVKLEQFDRTRKVVNEEFIREFFSCFQHAAEWVRDQGFDIPDENQIAYSAFSSKGI